MAIIALGITIENQTGENLLLDRPQWGELTLKHGTWREQPSDIPKGGVLSVSCDGTDGPLGFAIGGIEGELVFRRSGILDGPQPELRVTFNRPVIGDSEYGATATDDWHVELSEGDESIHVRVVRELPVRIVGDARIDAVAWSLERLDVFATSVQTNEVLHVWRDGEWNEYEPLKFTHGKSVCAASWEEGRIDLFSVTSAGDLIHKYFDGRWHATEVLDSGLLPDSPVASTSWGRGRIDVVALDPQGWIKHTFWDTDGWGGAVLFGVDNQGEHEAVQAAAGPLDIVSDGHGRLHVFFLGRPENANMPAPLRLISHHLDYGWGMIRAFTTRPYAPSSLSATCWDLGRLDLFVASPGGMQHFWREGDLWARPFGGQWEDLPGPSTLRVRPPGWQGAWSAPVSEVAAASGGNGRLDLFALADGHIAHLRYNKIDGWGHWEYVPRGGPFPPY